MTKIKDKGKKSKISLNNLNNVIDFDSLKPIFSFEFLQNGFNFKNRVELQKDHFSSFLYKIETLSKLTWREIKRLTKENGMENIELKVKTPLFITDDVLPLKCIRFGDIERIIGYRKGNIFYILYIDIKGELYNHSKNKK